MSTTITAEPWEIFSGHFLTKKRAHKCKKNTKIRKGNITSKNEKSKNHRNLKIVFLKSCLVPSSVNCSSIT
jgi:hypothetical protein